jgi:hypothetical protein
MKLRYLALLLPFLLCCNKKAQSPWTVQYVPFKFTTQFDSVFNTYPDSTFILTFNVDVLSGVIDTNPITFSVTGLPAGMTVTPASMTITHLLGGVFTFSTGNVPLGIDTLNFVISNKENGTQTHKLAIRVNPPPDYAPLLVGAYDSSYDFCMPADSIGHFAVSVATVADTPYEIKFTNLKNLGSGFIVTGWVSSVIKIPVQTIGSRTIWGSGTYVNIGQYQMTINDTVVHGTDTESCTIHIQH